MYKSFTKNFFFSGGAVNTIAGSTMADASTHEDRRLRVASSPAGSPATVTNTAPESCGYTELVVLERPVR